MKFIDEDGKIVEGTPITDAELASIDVLHQYFHHQICRYGYHSGYSTPPCEEAARTMVMKYGIVASDKLLDELPKPKVAEPEPEPIPVPVSTSNDELGAF